MEGQEADSYVLAKRHMAENDLLHAQTYALLYVGEQLEILTGILAGLAPSLDPRLRENMPTSRRKP